MKLNCTFGFVLVAGAALGLGSGCVKENHRITIGDMPLETFATDYQNASTEPSSGVMLAHKAEKLEEVSWKEVDFPVPNDGVGHRPTYRTEYARIKKTPRQRRESPSAESALDLGEETLNMQLREAFIFTPGILIYDTITMPFRMIGYPAYNHTRYSPRFTYQRDPINMVEAGKTGEAKAAAACDNTACGDACKCAAGACTCSSHTGGK